MTKVARRTLRYVEPQSEARTPLVDFFSILLEAVIELAGRRIAIRHILYEGGKLTKDGRAFLDREQPDLCIFGHMHQPKAEWFSKTLLFNPGSAGPKRFSLPRGIGLLTIQKEKVLPKLIRLSDNANRRNRSTGVKLPKKKGGTI